MEWTAVYGSAFDPGPRMLGAPRITTTNAEHVFSQPPTSASGSGSGTTRLVFEGVGGEDPMSMLSALPPNSEAARDVILAHARWDAPGSSHLSFWLRLASEEPEFAEILAARIADDGGDVQLLRLEQDLAETEEARAAVCAEQQRRGDVSMGGDAEYLQARCIADQAEKNRAFVAGHQQFPSNPFFARAAGSVFAAEGNYQDAAQALETALRQRSDLAAEVAIELARVRRALSYPNGATMHDLLPQSSMLAQMQGIEERAAWTNEGVGRSYTMLDEGRLDAAVTHAYGVDPDVAHGILRLAAASEGAPASLIERAHSLGPTDGVHYKTVWSAIALALKSGRDASPFVEQAEELVGEERMELMLGWADPIRLREEPEALEESLGLLDAELRGQARVMGIIALGEQAPQSWRDEASALLFSMERPHLGPLPDPAAAPDVNVLGADTIDETQRLIEGLRQQLDDQGY